VCLALLLTFTDGGLLNAALNVHIEFLGLFKVLHDVCSQNARMIKEGSDYCTGFHSVVSEALVRRI